MDHILFRKPTQLVICLLLIWVLSSCSSQNAACFSPGFVQRPGCQYLPGKLDTTFGENGFFYYDLSANETFATIGNASALDSQGNLFLSSHTLAAPSQLSPLELKVTREGVLDTSHGTNGSLVIPFAGNELGFSFVVLPDGSRVYAGALYAGLGNSDLCIRKVTPSGTLDPSFATAGRYCKDPGAGENSFDKIKLRSDGSFIASGILPAGTVTINGDTLNVYNPYVAAISSSGTLLWEITIPEYTSGHRAEVRVDSLTDAVWVSFADIQPSSTPPFGWVVRRYLANGSADSGFASSGKLSMPMNTVRFVQPQFIKQETDGSMWILADGNGSKADDDPALVFWGRIKQNGSLPEAGERGAFVEHEGVSERALWTLSNVLFSHFYQVRFLIEPVSLSDLNKAPDWTKEIEFPGRNIVRIDGIHQQSDERVVVTGITFDQAGEGGPYSLIRRFAYRLWFSGSF